MHLYGVGRKSKRKVHRRGGGARRPVIVDIIEDCFHVARLQAETPVMLHLHVS